MQRAIDLRFLLWVFLGLMLLAQVMKTEQVALPAELPEDQRVVLDEMEATHSGSSGEAEGR